MIRRDLLTALAGLGAGQLVLLATTPLLARAYDPHAFGVYSVNVAVAGVISTVAALRLDLAVTSAADEDVAPLAVAALLLPWATVPLMGFVLWLGLQLPVARGWSFGTANLPAILLIALPQGLWLAATALGTRRGRFGTTAAMRVAQPLVFAMLALLAVDNLSFAMAAGWGAALLTALPLLRGGRPFFCANRIASRVHAAWRFPLLSAPMALLDILALALPLLFVAAAFGERSAGNYAQVQRLVGAPLTLASIVVAQVFFKHAGDRVRANVSLLPLVRTITLAMTGLAGLVALAIAVMGEPLLHLLIGPGWRTDTDFLLLALCPVLCRVVASPVSTTLIVTGRLATVARWQVSYFTVTFAVLWLAQRYLTFDATLAAFACSEFIMYAIYLLLSVRAASGAAGPPTIRRSLAV